ncbi:serine/threonine-protein kinase HipA [Novimethylophilus kurashikiensis]|uniref:Serine/threonine-protein kinase HipA n=1 Tax=Novimethylophilus kurashikiensis TaxID=1825523 RepID=A0A2R5FBQ0_9PROT|nr:type II toxin-antitoxin system HipA family toxin [Novimethylophilus kurashikiensis]GBG14978.1 serine/threonine-protein kinase HipA [Novimethylophilus kurashikiensis]
MSEARSLNLYHDTQLVGSLFDLHPLKFVYAADWLTQPFAKPIAPALSLDRQEHAGEAVEAYFENLLPEANLRDLLKIKYQVSTLFGLLAAVGGDTASAYTLLPAGESPQPPKYQATTWEAIAQSLRPTEVSLAPESQNEGTRISLAGAQFKKSLLLMPDGTPALPLGNAPSSHILKPNIGNLEGVWASALNEVFMMKLARAIGLETAEIEYQLVAKSALIKRYDRMFNEKGALLRLHQLDLCQLDGKPSTIKYESDGGPSLARCRHLLQTHGVPAMDIKRLIEWVFFNLFIGNHDSHAKNLSIYYPPQGGARLAPFYDLLSTSLYPGLSRTFAFKIGGENIPGKIEISHIETMARELGFKPKYVLKIVNTIAASLLACIDAVTTDLSPIASPGTERSLLERLNQHITGNTRRLQARWGI